MYRIYRKYRGNADRKAAVWIDKNIHMIKDMNMKELWRSKGYKIRLITLVLLDIISINMCSLFALLIRYDFRYTDIPYEYLDNILKYSVPNTIVIMAVLWCCRLYKSVWSYASVAELFNVIKAVVISFGIQLLFIYFIFGMSMPKSYSVLYSILLFGCLLGLRFGYRLLRMLKSSRMTEKTNVMIVGAGQAGMLLAKEIQSSDFIKKRVLCFIDDNWTKHGKYLQGIQICGGRNDITKLVKRYDIDEIYVAMPSVAAKEIKEILIICNETGKKVMKLPGIYQLVNGDVSISKFKEVQIEDLLGREPVKVDMTEINASIEGKVVLVTGGGGSIGSELCRQIASYNPKQLIILDIYENNAYDIQQELKRKYGDKLDLKVLIGSVRNTHRINGIFKLYRPEIVFHAAAHKHVPLMEDSPNEAIKNNVFGTYKTASAAGRYGAKRFVLISTDKAVNPTNIMGASKRLCEMIVQCMNTQFDTEYVAVRFGNVLGSNGSVIPLFKKQIAEGGPVTVTDKEIVRYFMTIPEAVSLVLQAEAYAKGGEIFVLDMGEPVKIDTLARNLIRLSGLEPDVDIKIVYTGLRPGEKLYEEMLMKEEGLRETQNHLIHIGKPIDMDYEEFMRKLSELKDTCERDDEDIRETVKRLVPTYVEKNKNIHEAD